MDNLLASQDRLMRMLSTSMGPHVGELLEDKDVIELMLNPDGRLWVDRLGEGRSFTGYEIASSDAERIIFLVASAIGEVCNSDRALLSAELPGCGSRFQGLLPPVVASPVFTIRKKALLIHTLEEYVLKGILAESHRAVILDAVKRKQNILVTGGTGTGKTTLLNAILSEIARTGDRIVIIEDTLELQCEAPDTVFLRAREGVATMNDLLKATMRLRPDRIIVGEVRGGEALTLLKAMNTGHPGSLATVHANGAKAALTRLEHLIQEAVVTVPKALIAEAVNMIVFIDREGTGRRVKEIARVEGVSGNDYRIRPL